MAFLLLLVWSPAAFSALSLPASSAPADCAHWNGTLSQPETKHYRCVSRAFTVDFFVNEQNVIHKITWFGRRSPPLDLLLGPKAKEYTEALQVADVKAPSGRGLKRAMKHQTKSVTVTRRGNGRMHVGEMILNSPD